MSKMFGPKDKYFLGKSKKMYCNGCEHLKTAREHGVVGSKRNRQPAFWCSLSDRQICTRKCVTPFFCPL